MQQLHSPHCEATACRDRIASTNAAQSPADHALLAAARDGDHDGVMQALRDGANIDAQDADWNTAILFAATRSDYDLVDRLADLGANVNLQNKTCFNPFIYGCINNDLQLVRLMVEHGCHLELLTRMGGNGLTPACEKGYVEIVEYLVSSTNINVNHTNHLGWTALVESIILSDGGPSAQAIVRLLLEHGANPGMPDEWGRSPIHLAREHGHDAIVELLSASH